jgi:3-dehydroquinate synthase
MAVKRIRVIMEDGKRYDVRIGQRLLVNLGVHMREATEATRAVVIGDTNTMGRFARHARTALEKADFSVDEITVLAGEASKDIAQAIELWDALAELGIGRDAVIVALGGGVVGDLVGFVASTYMRGIPCVQVPTTLLAMVDSSVGGKTAVDRPQGKNLVGTFAQPVYVAADLATLASLPDAEWENGFAEICKSAMVDSEEFSVWLAENAAGLMAHDSNAVQLAIVKTVSFKADVVTHDEKEKGRRECLNYGHTFGHALEATAGYGVLSHGRAVAEGMRFAARLAVEVLETAPEFVLAQDALLDAMGLPALATAYPADELLAHMLSDKKVRGGVVRFVLPSSPGAWEVREVPLETLREHLEAWSYSRSGISSVEPDAVETSEDAAVETAIAGDDSSTVSSCEETEGDEAR